MRKMMLCMDRVANEAVEALQKRDKDNATVDLKDFCGRYTLDVIAGCCFALQPKSHVNVDNVFIVASKKLFRPRWWIVAILTFCPTFLMNLIVRKFVKNKYMDYFQEICEHLIKERRLSGQRVNDFLQLLIDCNQGVMVSDKEPDLGKDTEAHHVLEDSADAKLASEMLDKNENKSKRLSDIETVAGALSFLLAGYETTGTLLTLTFYQLAVNPDIQEKLFKSISGANLDYESISSNEYLDAVVSETLRIHPPVALVDREANEDYAVPTTNIVLRKGSNAIFPIHSIHHDPDNYENPDKFIPERFLPENRHKIKPYTYLPFGVGPR